MEKEQLEARRTLNLILGDTGLTGEIKQLNKNLKNYTITTGKHLKVMAWLTGALVFLGGIQIFFHVF